MGRETLNNALPDLSIRSLLLILGDFTNAVDKTEDLVGDRFAHQISREDVIAEILLMVGWLNVHRKNMSNIEQLLAKMPDVLFSGDN